MKLCMGCMQQIEDCLTVCPYCGFNETTLRQESYYLKPGTVVGGKYIVGRVLDYGGYTVSYLGLDAEANRRVVVREYLPSDFSTRSEGEQEVTIYSGDAQQQFGQGLTNFLNEANRIQHLEAMEGIARVYDCVAENDTGYVISEYVEGKTLSEILKSGKRYDVEEARRFISQILAGLSKVHPMDIIHCDISPESIMVTDNGSIKLLNFGATRYVTTANSKSLAIILKQGYAPEEQYRSQGVRGPWTDVYALAAVMYRMITGVRPQESVERALVDDLKEPSKLGIKIPENIENALMNALNVYQHERTSSAKAFLQELNSLEVKRRKVKKQKNETGKFPLWARILVAVLSCAVIAGGIVLYKMSKTDVESVTSTSVKMIDLSGKEWKEVEDYAKDLNNKHRGWKIKVENTGSVFDKDSARNGRVATQTIPVNTDFSKPKSEESEGDWSRDANGNVTATIQCTVFSSEAVHYGEIRDLTNNAYVLGEKLLGEDALSDGTRFCQKDEADKSYYALDSLVTADGTEIKAKEIENGKEEQLIPVSGLKIYYYASDFFYWEKLPDFQGKNINKLKAYPVYYKENEGKPIPRKKKNGKGKTGKLAGSSLVDDGYYTFENYEPGYICGQLVNPGKKLDGSQQKKPFLHVIKEQIAYRGKTGSEVAQKVSWANTKVSFAGGGKGQEVVSVEVRSEKDELRPYFKKDEALRIVITTKKKEVPATTYQAPEKKANQNSSNGSGSVSKKKKSDETEWNLE